MVAPIENVGSLRAFVTAAELRSFKLAGQQLAMSPSGIGKAIQKLEEQLGVRLFFRSTRSIAMTEEGARFLERSRRILDELDSAQAELAESTGVARGRLKLSMPIAAALFTPVIAAFAAAHPEITLDLDFNDRFVDIIEEGFDVVIRSGEPNDSRLHHKKLGAFEWCLVASPSYLERAGAPFSIADLSNFRCLRHRYPQTGKIAPWLFTHAPENVSIPVSLTATLVDSLVILAERGTGIASLPRFHVRDALASGRLVEVLPNCLMPQGVFRLLWPASPFQQPKVRAFVDFVGKTLVI